MASDWLDHMVQPVRSYVAFKFANLGEQDKECFREWLVNMDPDACEMSSGSERKKCDTCARKPGNTWVSALDTMI